MSTGTPGESAITIVGAGAAGLFAAEAFARAGISVHVLEHRENAARKLRVAGSSGLNLTNTLPLSEFAGRYGDAASRFRSLLADFPPEAVIAWATTLGAETYRGSSGKILTADGSGAALINGLLGSIEDSGLVSFSYGCRFIAFAPEGGIIAQTADGSAIRRGAPVLLALGGASWPLTGSDGAWVHAFSKAGIRVNPLKGANCGFRTPVAEGETGERYPIKNIALRFGGTSVRGEIMLTPTGIEGGPVYAHASVMVRSLESQKELVGKPAPAPSAGDPAVGVILEIDLFPDLSPEEVARRLGKNRGKASASTFVRKALRLDIAHAILLRRALGRNAFTGILENPRLVKALPLPCLESQPIEEAISSSGGVAFDELDDNLMLKRFPGIYCAGEMLDWDAPTGGFLLTGCFATAHRALSHIMGIL